MWFQRLSHSSWLCQYHLYHQHINTVPPVPHHHCTTGVAESRLSPSLTQHTMMLAAVQDAPGVQPEVVALEAAPAWWCARWSSPRLRCASCKQGNIYNYVSTCQIVLIVCLGLAGCLVLGVCAYMALAKNRCSVCSYTRRKTIINSWLFKKQNLEAVPVPVVVY
ncbi:uncharacterized protein [Cherax quadricarinatus]|uniref:uncharacterized protein isoform X1 n=2 Tax=Cherax quadricarinatus TaxID=27406 RepID=UPI00387EAF13